MGFDLHSHAILLSNPSKHLLTCSAMRLQRNIKPDKTLNRHKSHTVSNHPSRMTSTAMQALGGQNVLIKANNSNEFSHLYTDAT